MKQKRNFQRPNISAQILPMPGFRASTQPIAEFLRVGETGHRQLADLHAEGRLPAKRVVVDASRLRFQKELIEAFRSDGAEIVLDTKAAELAAVARFDGYARGAPWAECGNGEPLGPDHFNRNAPTDVIGQIARFAVQHRMHAVLAPGHFLAEGSRSAWFAVDQDVCLALRDALDREGGAEIGIDYPLILGHTLLNDESMRGEIVDGLSDLPFDNLWVRASGFGSDGAANAVKRYIVALWKFHNLGKPVVADYLGGIVGLAAIAFGAVSGIAHGIGERERFDARSWHKPPPKRDENSGGRPVRITIPGLDKSLTTTELELLANARGARRLVVCGDRACCPHGLDDMLGNPRRHAAFQRFAQIGNLERIPDFNRTQHFLNGTVKRANQLAREVTKLKTGSQSMEKRLINHKDRITRLQDVLDNLYESHGTDIPRSAATIRRVPGGPIHHRGED